jgi:hypothetical protein
VKYCRYRCRLGRLSEPRINSVSGSARNGPRNRKSRRAVEFTTRSFRVGRLAYYLPPSGSTTPQYIKTGRRGFQYRRPIRVASHRMSTQSPTPNPYAHPSFFPTHALVRAPTMTTFYSTQLIIIFLAGPCVCWYWGGNGRGALHEPARLAQSQVSSIDARTG